MSLEYNKFNIDLFITNGTLDFANKIITIDQIDLIRSGIHIHPMPHAILVTIFKVKTGKKRLIVQKLQCVRKFWVIVIDTLYEKGLS